MHQLVEFTIVLQVSFKKSNTIYVATVQFGT